MVFLRVLPILSLLFVFPLLAQAGDVINIVNAKCSDLSKEACERVRNRFQDFEGVSYQSDTFNRRLRFKLSDSPYKKFSYKVLKNGDQLEFHVHALPKKKIGDISINYNVQVNLPELSTYIPAKSGDYFDRNKIQAIRSSLENFLSDRGFQDLSIIFHTTENEKTVDIKVDVELKSITRVKEVRIATSNPKLIGRVESRFLSFEGEILDRLRFKLVVDQLSRELFESGFYHSEVTLLPEQKVDSGKGVILRVKVKYGPLYSFYFQGNNYKTRSELLSIYSDAVRKSDAKELSESFKNEVIQAYEQAGLYGTDVNISKFEGVNKSELSFVNFFVHIKEGQKKPVGRPIFRGNTNVSDEALNELYDKSSSVLASRNFLDMKFLKDFQSELKEFYLARGHVFAEVSGPIIENAGSLTNITYSIRERQQAKLSSIRITPLESELEGLVANKLKNKVGEPVNIPALESDLDTVLDELHSEGYFFAEIKNLSDDSLLTYSSNFSEADLKIELESSRKVELNTVLVTGYDKTKLEVLTREIPLKKGDLITPKSVAKIKERLISLDLFSSVRVAPEVLTVQGASSERQKANLLIQVDEKAFGVGEVAPGFRTDLGAKASVGLTYNNISGMNRSVSVNLEANRRIDYSDFDTRRRKEEKDLTEYSAKVNFNEPYLFSSELQFDASSAYQRKRFVSFDADIFRVSPQISKVFFDKLTLSVKYQYEEIRQFDATNKDFNDDFTIGSVTPSFTFDLRDDPVRPRKGAFFGLDWEFANPTFFSMDDEDITVNYYRMISRNNFYVPISDHFTLAFSLAGGIQKNFADEIQYDENGDPLRDSDGNIVRKGFIPSTKVFRLDGIDTVRGFDGQEINRLRDSRNIGEVVVNDTAYFFNVKFEPRYYFSDNFALGGFFDAGRVFVDTFRPLDLRSAVGLTFKLLTPVGSLDFDYGVKLKRKRFESEGRESFGRFHLTIGFF